MSINSSDDDIPGLESVSGSEYIESPEDSEDDDDDDAPGVVTDWLDPKSPHYVNAKQWLTFDASILIQHVNVIRVYVLSPFLYGHAHQSDRWLKWCHEVGLLKSDIEFNLDTLSEKEMVAVDVLLKALNYVGSTLMGRVDDIPKLLQLAEDIEVIDSVSRASRLAHKKNWFMILIEEFRKSADKTGGVPSDILYSKNNFVEIGCLYVINQAAEHVMKVLTGKEDYHSDFLEQLRLHEESGKVLKDEGEEQEKNGDYDQAIDTYTTAIICCPYYYQLYINRAYAYMEIQKFRASVTDGLRAVHLNPGNSRGYICYIQALKAFGDTERVKVAIDDFNRRFPKEKEHLKRSIEQLRGLDKKIRVPTEKEEVLNEKLLGTCKQASEAYLAGSFDEAIFYYQEALATSKENHTWQICWVFSDCELFLVSLHFAFGMALLKKGHSENVEKALVQFSLIISEYKFSHFPAVYYAIGKSLATLHRHSEALASIEKGLSALTSYCHITLTWPGTSVNIVECLPHDIEVKLHQLQQLCEPMKSVDAVCRYANCLHCHTSSDIILGKPDYKGHVRVQCLEGCFISYHPTCWRKFKSDCVVGANRDFLNSSCPTPDCGGRVKVVSVFDSGGLKIKLEAEATLTTPNALPNTLYLSSSGKENKRQAKFKKKLNSGTPDTTSKANTPGEFPNDKVEEEVESNDIEDLRKVEDSLAIINRHVEEDEQESGVGKSHKTKKKTRTEKSKMNSEHWNNLFILPEREGALNGSTANEDSSISKWVPDPSVPFQPPKHLRDVIDKFETDEAPSIGLHPRPVVSSGGGGGGGDGGGGGPTSNSTPLAGKVEGFSTDLDCKDNLEFIRSYFEEIVKSYGPLDLSDPQIIKSLSYLSEENKRIIYKHGGISNILVESGSFTIERGLLCLVEEVGVVAPMTSSSFNKKKGKKSSEEGVNVESSQTDGVNKNKKKNAHGERSSSSVGRNAGGNNAKHSKSSLNGLFPTTRKSGDGGTINLLEYIKSRQQNREVDMGWNVRLSSMTPPADMPGKEGKNTVKDSLSPAKRKGTVETKTSKPSKSAKDKKNVISNLKNGLKIEEGSSVSECSDNNTELFLKLPFSHKASFNGSMSKDSSQNSSGSEGGGWWMESNNSNSSSSNAEKRSVFSPTNSTSSVSSGGGGGGSSSALIVLSSKKTSKSKKSAAKKAVESSSSSSQYSEYLSENAYHTSSSIPLKLISTMVQTDTPLFTDKWVMTETIPPVECFKERYDSALTEKNDLQVKLERSEDQKFKLQKSHKREMEKMISQSKMEAKEEYHHKLREVEEKLKIESGKVDVVKKENSEQLRATKAEVKSLTDKIERMKKESLKKEQQNETTTKHLNEEIEKLQIEQQNTDDRLKFHQDAELKTTIRATNAEIEILSMCRDMIVKPLEQKLRGIDNICVTMPQGSDAQRECMGYREKVKNALMSYQNVIEDQVRQVNAGRTLSSLTQVPPPIVPPPPNLAMLMQPGFVPMMNVPRAPFPMGGVVDPSMMMSRPLRPPPPPMGGGIPGGIPVSTPPSFMPQVEPESDPIPNLSNSAVEDLEPALTGTASHSDVDNGGGSGKKSSFDRIVEKLCPLYPHYARDDFKGVLREVRRNNNNTLSGLSLDSIAQQVTVVIDQREKRGVNRGTGASGKGKGSSKNHEKKMKKPRLPPVAVAPPPVSSQIDYDNENCCVICYEDMRRADSNRLNCGHRFHSKCIRSWFKEQSTCPTCRNHSLLVEEYPSLK